ncbi:MAG: arylsulfatase [Prolixibacteraceae bacterium]|jgi:arylsulfatase A|nr:arylsulfatase [Prolixibacteraceae bacterium]MBT6766700.1 arylsulfatase [Prolixibacteraceae bacterium]MBT7000694.1 arylsulfatase [Prolixibacteraceae bacterium]MBT7396136.1 arylsulfatase [Prolixibacteraceae bacterium]
MRHLIISVLSILFLTNCSTKSELPENPNIVIILADDMGYGDVQALNPKSNIPTPNLNRLAEEGIIFMDAHSPSAVCTPTRYGLLTGRYSWRSRLKRGVQNGYGEPLIETDRPTIATLLKEVGYKTGIVGKWHLGLGFQKNENGEFDFSKSVTYSPNNVGFDYSYIIPASLDFPPYVYIENTEITEFPSIVEEVSSFPGFWRKGERSPDFVMEETLDHLLYKANGFIENNANKENPFLLYFPLTAPHKPVLPHERFRGETELGVYGDFVHQVDWTVGEVLKKLDELKIAENTLVIYTSDNGSFMYRRNAGELDHLTDETLQQFDETNHTSNYVFRGTKADIWEAGHHVPFFVRWPKNIKAGSKVDNTISLTDIYSTLSQILNHPQIPGSGEDSFSFYPLLNGNGSQYSRVPVIHHSVSGMFSIRKGDWKLVLGNGSGGREQPKGNAFEKPYQLFNLKEDLSEKNNVIEKYPEIAAELEKECLTIKGED